MKREAYLKHREVIEAWAEGAEVEYWAAKRCRWETLESPMWYEGNRYRIKKQSKPSIDWDCLHSDWRWLARDACGGCHVFCAKPVFTCGVWEDQSKHFLPHRKICVGHLTSLNRGECEAKDSLVCRHEKSYGIEIDLEEDEYREDG